MLGSGNVATQLSKALANEGHTIVQVFSQNIENAKALAQKHKATAIDNLSLLNGDADLYIISVSDHAIEKIISGFDFSKKRVVHTAGSVALNIFPKEIENFGVFYPFQTFSKNKTVNFAEIPICVEANNNKFEQELIKLAEQLSGNVSKISSEQRKKLHLSGVFACNFVNHLYYIASNILSEHKIDEKLLVPLIKETADKVSKLPPFQAQTGPAVRNDTESIKKHLDLLSSSPEYQQIYKLFSDAIYNTHNSKQHNDTEQLMDNFKERLKDIKAFVFDVDGVFSANVFLQPDGDMLRSMNTKDGYALQYALKEQGFLAGIITGGYSDSIKKRFNGLGTTDVYIKSLNKLDDFEDFMYKYDLKPEQIVYMGDDLPDYEVMKMVGIPTCPADAAEEIKAISVYISDKKGGDGCVRDIIEQVLRAQGKWVKL